MITNALKVGLKQAASRFLQRQGRSSAGAIKLRGWPRMAVVCLALWGTFCSAAAQTGPRAWVTPAPGDVVRGAAAYQTQCTACHAIDKNQTGPAHRGVMGRRVGSLTGYRYSDELARSRLRWTPQTLNAWLEDPESVVVGQRMGFQVDDAQDRADLIAYLATLK